MAFGQPYFYQGGAIPDQLSAYKQAYQQPYQPAYQGGYPGQASVQGNGMLWTQGEVAAKSWPVAPGSTVVLWDSESQNIYIKSADASGIPSMRTLRWEEVSTIPPSGGMAKSEGARAEERMKALEEQVSALSKKVEELTNKQEEA